MVECPLTHVVVVLAVDIAERPGGKCSAIPFGLSVAFMGPGLAMVAVDGWLCCEEEDIVACPLSREVRE